MGETKDQRFAFLLTAGERESLNRLAKEAGVTDGEWLRGRVRAAAEAKPPTHPVLLSSMLQRAKEYASEVADPTGRSERIFLLLLSIDMYLAVQEADLSNLTDQFQSVGHRIEGESAKAIARHLDVLNRSAKRARVAIEQARALLEPDGTVNVTVSGEEVTLSEEQKPPKKSAAAPKRKRGSR